jgi:hypothetical protein
MMQLLTTTEGFTPQQRANTATVFEPEAWQMEAAAL